MFPPLAVVADDAEADRHVGVVVDRVVARRSAAHDGKDGLFRTFVPRLTHRDCAALVTATEVSDLVN